MSDIINGTKLYPQQKSDPIKSYLIMLRIILSASCSDRFGSPEEFSSSKLFSDFFLSNSINSCSTRKWAAGKRNPKGGDKRKKKSFFFFIVITHTHRLMMTSWAFFLWSEDRVRSAIVNFNRAHSDAGRQTKQPHVTAGDHLSAPNQQLQSNTAVWDSSGAFPVKHDP